jgi:hypothetical protein
MEDFKDKPEVKSNVLFIMKCRNDRDLVKFISNIYPTWIFDIADKYEDDLKPLINNWNFVCKRVKTTRKKILLVEKIVFENDENIKLYKTITSCLNRLTSFGYCVRSKTDFTTCLTEGCNTVLLCKKMRNSLYKQKKCNRVFTNLCLDCMSKRNV